MRKADPSFKQGLRQDTLERVWTRQQELGSFCLTTTTDLGHCDSSIPALVSFPSGYWQEWVLQICQESACNKGPESK